MRVSTSQRFNNATNQINVAELAFVEAQTQVSTGKRINVPSDDPMGTSVLLSAQTIQGNVQQYQSNLDSANNYLKSSESAVGEMTTLLQQANQLALSGANSSTDQNARNEKANQISQIQQRMVDLANSQGESGQYVFAGQLSTTKPFTVNAGVLTYSGDANNVIVQTGPSQTMNVNTNLNPFMQQTFAALSQLQSDLQGGSVSNISGVDVAAMQTAITSSASIQGDIGARMQSVQDLQADNTTRLNTLATQISNVQDVDIAQAITKYSSAQTAYQAALAVGAQSFNLSLLNFMGTSTPA